MTYNLKIISIAGFYRSMAAIVLLIIVLFITIGLQTTLSQSNKNLIMILFVSLLLMIFFVPILVSRKKIKLNLTDSSLEYNRNTINLKEIQGYRIEKSGRKTILEFKTEKKAFSLFGLNKGRYGKEFEDFLDEFIKKLLIANNQASELSYYEIHTTIYKFQRWFVPLSILVVVIINLIFFYKVSTDKMEFNGKIFIVDILALSVYFYHRESLTIKK